MKPQNISVAIEYTGNRADKMIIPLRTTTMDIKIEPDKPYNCDIVLLDNADRNIIYPMLRKRLPFTDTKVVYRMRGNVYEEISRWHINPYYEWIALKILADADGFICVNEGMATIAKRHSGVENIGVAGLSKETENWPTINHTNNELRFISLTNADYFEKAEPLVRYAHVIENWCREWGGYWSIYGNGIHTEWLDYALEQFNYVSYHGYTENPKETIKDYNCMLHISELDALPNSVLEGLASGLPVITNPFHAFTESKAPLEIFHDKYSLIDILHKLKNPYKRKYIGGKSEWYIDTYHTPERIGQQYVNYFQKIVR